MAYRVHGDRVALPIEDGPTVEVQPIGSWPIYWHAVGLTSAFLDAKGPAAELEALMAAYGFFVREAQPTWEIVDHRGPVPATAEGMLRLPVLEIGIRMVDAWAETFLPKPTAVDAMIPEGPLRDELNAGLRRKAKAH